MKRHYVLLLAAALAACKDDGDTAQPFCQAIGGSGAQATEVCDANCNHENIAAAVDARFGTAAIIGVSVQAQGTLRGTAPDGVVFPGGAAGVYVRKPPFVRGGTFDITVSTYLDGVLQDSDAAFSESGATDGDLFCNICEPDGDNLFIGIPAGAPFDAIEIAYTQSAGTQYREIELFEFCTR